MHSYVQRRRRRTDTGQNGSPPMTGPLATAQLRDTLNRSPRVVAQLNLGRALNRSPAVAAQARHAQVLSARNASVVQRFWYDTEFDSGIIWIDDDVLEQMDVEQTGATHSEADGHPAGPVWKAKADEPAGEQLPEEGLDVLSDEPIWQEIDLPQEGITPGIVSVKDVARGIPAFEGPTAAWGDMHDFAELGWDATVSNARITRPFGPTNHVTFWCKVGDIDVMVHLTQAGYALLYGADRDIPGESEIDTTKKGLTGKDLYAEFLKIAIEAGGYREGANECQTFANRMLSNLTEATDDVDLF